LGEKKADPLRSEEVHGGGGGGVKSSTIAMQRPSILRRQRGRGKGTESTPRSGGQMGRLAPIRDAGTGKFP